MHIAVRFITGFAIGFEINAVPGVYFSILLGIIEIVGYNEEEFDDE